MKYPYPTTRDTAELIALKKKAASLSFSGRLRLAAELIDEGKAPLAETIAGEVVDELRIFRIVGSI